MSWADGAAPHVLRQAYLTWAWIRWRKRWAAGIGEAPAFELQLSTVRHFAAQLDRGERINV